MRCTAARSWLPILAITCGLESAAVAAPAKRTVPDYSGRGPAPTTVLERLAWIPRIALFPVRVVVDYGVRTPVGWLTRFVERSRSTRSVVRRLFLGPPGGGPQYFPIALYDFGSQPSIGVRIVWTDGFLRKGSKLYVKLGTGGLEWWRVDTGVRVGLGEGYAGFDVGARRQPDFRFYGLGPRPPESAAARFGARKLVAKVGGGLRLREWGEVGAFTAATNTTFRRERYGGDPTIDERVAEGKIDSLPVGYPDGFSTVRTGGTFALDTRRRHKRVASGARVDAKLERVWNTDDADQRWTRLELRGGGALLLDPATERKLTLRLEANFVEGATDEVQIPFLELASVAGKAHLGGFPTGRLYGESAAALTLDYDWPIAAWLDAHAHLGAGNAFGHRLSGFSAGALRASAGFGVSLAGLTEDRYLEVSTWVGSDPLEDGLEISSFRLIIGFTNDY